MAQRFTDDPHENDAVHKARRQERYEEYIDKGKTVSPELRAAVEQSQAAMRNMQNDHPEI